MAIWVAKLLLMAAALAAALLLGYLARERKAQSEAERGDPGVSIFAFCLLVVSGFCGLMVVFS